MNVRSFLAATRLTAVATGLIVALSGTASAQFQIPIGQFLGYNLVDLGAALPGWSFATAINPWGQVVGDMKEPSGELRAFRTQANQPIVAYVDDLGVMSGNYRSYAHAIDNYGVVVGSSVRNSPSIQSRAFRWGYNGAVMEDLHPATGATDTFGRGTNDYSWNVGYYKTGSLSRSFLSFGPGWTYLIDAWLGSPAQSETYDINNLSQWVGWKAATLSSQPRAYLFDAAANKWRLTEIGTLQGGIWSKAYAIGENRHVVGESDKWVGMQRWTHAFLFRDANDNGTVEPGELVDLDSQNSFQSGALAVNYAGVAVGYTGSPDVVYGTSRATIFSGGAMTDLHTQVRGGTNGWTLRTAAGINDGGQIVGFMEDSNPDKAARVRHAYRLDPVYGRYFIR